MRRVVVVRGPHAGQVIEHEPADGAFFRVRAQLAGAGRRALAALTGRPTRGRSVLYRVFSRAAPTDERAEFYAAAWCEQHDTFADRCPHAPDRPTHRWVRFGPRLDQTKLDAGAPGTRASKWHEMKNWRQVEEPWVTICDLIVYGPIIEEFRHEVLTPVGVPVCRNCKRLRGLGERGVSP